MLMGGVQLVWAGQQIREMGVQPMGKMGKDYCPNFLQPLLEHFDSRSCNDWSWERIPIFHNPHRKSGPSPPAVARTLGCLEGCPLRPRRVGKRKKQVRIKFQETVGYLECDNQVGPLPSPLQGMKAQLLQTLHAVEMTNFIMCLLSGS